MYRKLSILLIFLFLITSFGFGCRGLSSEEKTAVKTVQLTYWTVYNDISQLRKYVEDYRKIRPYVKIDVRQIRYEEFDRVLINALADDVGPDIISMHTRWINKYTKKLTTMPKTVQMARVSQKGKFKKEIEVTMETLAMPSVKAIRSNYVRTIGENIIIGNKVYGLPLSFDTIAIYYNKDLLDKAGIPQPPTDWTEFMEAVHKTTRFDSQGRIVQAGTALGSAENITNSFDLLSLLMMQSGIKMSSGRMVAFTSGVSSKTSVHPLFKALDFYTDFANPTKESYAWNEQMDNAFNEFIRGKVVFYFGYAYDYKQIKRRAPGMNFEIIPIFQLNEASPVNIANFWVEAVMKKSKNQNEAWDFVRFITSPDKAKEYADATFRPTPLRSQIREQQENELMAPFVSQVLFAENWYKGKNYDSAEEAFHALIKGYNDQSLLGQAKFKRDVQLIDSTAVKVQQTM